MASNARPSNSESTLVRVIDTIPPEIWATIFSIPNSSNRLPGRSIYKRRTSILVSTSQVCSRWRAITLNTRALWTYIYHEAWGEHQYPNPKLVQLWLARSGDAPLSVELSLRTIDQAENQHYACYLAVIQQFPRWKTASLDITLHSWAEYLWNVVDQSITAKTAPFLKSLRLIFTYYKYNHNHNKSLPSALWTDAPALTQLTVQVIEVAPRPEVEDYPAYNWTLQNRIPYSQITHLRLNASNVENVAWDTVLLIFHEAPNLISCFLAGVRNSTSQTFEREPAILHHLRYLHVGTPQIPHAHRWTLPGQLHLALVAPALLILSFSECAVWDQHSFATFISKSSPPNLHELHFLETRIHQPEFLECLRLCPTLTNIYIRDAVLLKDLHVLHALGKWDPVAGQFDLVPRLQQLSLSTYETSKWDTEVISRLTNNLLKPRLLPPGTEAAATRLSRSFSTLSIPFRNKESQSHFWVRGLKVLRGSPWNLQVLFQDHSVVSQLLWKAP